MGGRFMQPFEPVIGKYFFKEKPLLNPVSTLLIFTDLELGLSQIKSG
jgi:hypothetical protein